MPTATATRRPIGREVSSGGRVITRKYSFVDLVIHRIHCVKTTREIDRDEIYLSAIAPNGVDLKPNRKKVLEAIRSPQGFAQLARMQPKGDLIYAGKFKKGDTWKRSNGWTIARFRLGPKNLPWPRIYSASLVLIEKDKKDVSKFVDRIDDQVVKFVEKNAEEAVDKGLMVLTQGVPVPYVGEAVGDLVGDLTGKILTTIKKAGANEIFDAREVQARLRREPRGAEDCSDRTQTMTFRGFGGEYKVTYSWSLVRKQS